MKKFSKSIILLLLVAAGVIYSWYFISQKNNVHLSNRKFYPSRNDWKFLEKAILIIQQNWSFPDKIKEVNWSLSDCKLWDFSKYHQPVDLRQNPYVFDCYLSNSLKYRDSSKSTLDPSIIAVTIGGKTKSFVVQKSKSNTGFEYINFSQNLSSKSDVIPFEKISLTLTENDNGGHSVNIILPFDQSEKYLPKGIYYYGQDISSLPKKLRDRFSFDAENSKKEIYSKVRTWDNYNRDFIIDKYPVRNFQVENIIKDLSVDIDKTSRGEFSLRLARQLQRQVCFERGMVPLQAYVWDAATYLRDTSNQELEINRSLYFFGDRWDEKNFCRLQPSKECKLKFEPKLLEDSLTWMGLAGVSQFFESFDNDIDPYFNIKTSSLFFSKDSVWQILAHRFHWSGEGFLKEDRIFVSSIAGVMTPETQLETQFSVAFRCMKELVTYP